MGDMTPIKTTKAIRKRPRKSKAVAPLPTMPAWDMGASGQANQDRLVDQERGTVDITTGKRINPNAIWGRVREPWVTRYAKQGKISAEHVAAALRLYAAYAGHPDKDPLARIGDRVDGGGTNDPNVTQVDKRREFYAMWARVPGSSRPTVEHVVLNDLPMRGMVGCSNAEREAVYFGRLTAGLEAVT